LLIKMKNAEDAEKYFLKTKYTKMDSAVTEILTRYGFVKSFDIKGKSYKKVIEMELSEKRPIKGIKFLSKPSLRRYSGYGDFRRVKSGFGLLVVSTSKGVMSGDEARKEKVGGQLLFQIW
ncbi:MAG: 30S ribosomal protein S8, partial [Patescibacteria group bacterium]